MKKNDPNDNTGHGTQVAGIIGAIVNNNLGIAGIAPGVQLMACKWMHPQHALDKVGKGQIEDAIKCIEYACDHGAHILNCSWGALNLPEKERAALEAVFEQARNKGIFVVLAAGNSAKNNDQEKSYPASFSHHNMIVVAATTETGQLAPFSNYGQRTVHLAAPGTRIVSAGNRSDAAYKADHGTSFAAPHVTAALALMMAKFPNTPWRELRDRLRATASKELLERVAWGRLNLVNALAWYEEFESAESNSKCESSQNNRTEESEG